LSETHTQDYFKLWPNPNSGIFSIELEIGINRQWKLMITDLSGKIFQQLKSESQASNNNISLDLPAGVYSISLYVGSELVQTESVTVISK